LKKREENFGNDRVFFLMKKLLYLIAFDYPTGISVFPSRPWRLTDGSQRQTAFTSGNEFGKSSESKSARI